MRLSTFFGLLQAPWLVCVDGLVRARAVGGIGAAVAAPRSSCGWRLPRNLPSQADAASLSSAIWAGNGRSAASVLSKEDEAAIRAEPGADDPARPDTFLGEQCHADAYGEITRAGAQSVLGDKRIALGPKDVFFDLGAGFGRLTLAAAAQWHTARAVGVELSTERFERSCALLGRLRGNFSEAGDGDFAAVEMVRGSLLDQDLSTASVVYVANLCFPPGLQNHTRVKLARELPVGARLAALQPFFEPKGGAVEAKQLSLAGITTAETTWDKAARVFLYHVLDRTIVQRSPQPGVVQPFGEGNETAGGVEALTQTEPGSASGGGLRGLGAKPPVHH